MTGSLGKGEGTGFGSSAAGRGCSPPLRLPPRSVALRARKVVDLRSSACAPQAKGLDGLPAIHPVLSRSA